LAIVGQARLAQAVSLAKSVAEYAASVPVASGHSKRFQESDSAYFFAATVMPAKTSA
jgi:hypothetical protein